MANLQQAYTAMRIIETAENYTRADQPLHADPRGARLPGGPVFRKDYDDDGKFWNDVFRENTWGTKYHLMDCVLSEWVARVPGLFWKPGSEEMRQLNRAAVESRSKKWETYTPQGKSQKVLGGVGTLRLPPAPDGYRLASVTTTLNASAGVPVLIAPEIWDHLHLKEGCMIQGKARWQAMADGWSSRFKSTSEIPCGYLVLDDPDVLKNTQQDIPVLIHPFTVMEYESGPAQLFDYVYCGEDTRNSRHRKNLQQFFNSYKKQKKRHGRFLLAADIADPLWDADYKSPEALRGADPVADPQLRLLEARVHSSMLGRSNIDELLKKLASDSTTHEDLKRVSKDNHISPSKWFTGATVARSAAQLLDKAIADGKLPELVEVVAREHNEWFR